MKDNASRSTVPEDGEIIEYFRRGDEAAISFCMRKYGAYCRRLAFGVLRSEPDAEECVNDAMFSLWRSFPKQGDVCLPALAATVTRRTAIDRYRRNTRKSSPEAESLPIDELYEELHVPGAEQEYLEAEAGRVINEFLRKLDRKKRLIFLMRYYESRTPAEIAGHMGVTASAVNKSLAKTKKQLKTFLERNGINV